MQISTIYDRTEADQPDDAHGAARHPHRPILVTLVLLLMLGDLRITFIAAVTIPFAVLFAFGMMVLTGRSANLISIGAIDFGILVDASIIVLESVYRKLSRRGPGRDRRPHRGRRRRRRAAGSLLHVIILVAFIPLFTMQGVPGKIFAPMSVTYGFALRAPHLRAHLCSRAQLRQRARQSKRSAKDTPG